MYREEAVEIFRQEGCGVLPLAEIDRLRAIEAAAKKWRKSLEDDGWAKEAIEDGFCRDGIQDLMKLITV